MRASSVQLADVAIDGETRAVWYQFADTSGKEDLVSYSGTRT